MPIPAGSDVSTSVRTPGDASAPQTPACGRSRSGCIARDGGSAVNITVPATTLDRRDHQRGRRREHGRDHRGEQRAEHEDQLDQHRVERVGDGDQLRLVAQERRPHRAQHRRRRRDREAGQEAARDEHAGRQRRPRRSRTISAERGAVDQAERDQDAPLAERVDEPALHRRADACACGQRARDDAGDRERPALGPQVEDDRQRVDADREPRQQRRRDQRRHVRALAAPRRSRFTPRSPAPAAAPPRSSAR